MMASSHPDSGFINYPAPKRYDIPYKAPPEPTNPVIKGRVLSYLANVVAAVPFISSTLYTNAGFAELRNLKAIQGLEGVEPRFDPTVIPVGKDGDASDSMRKSCTDYQQIAELRDRLNQSRSQAENAAKSAFFYSIADFHEAYKTGKITPADVVEALLPLIRRDVSTRSPHSTAFVDSHLELVRAAADASTKRWKEGRPLGVLDGVPFAVKDEMDVKGYKRYLGTTKDYTEGKEVETSWCVKKLEEEGSICVGKTSMHELGMDTTNNNMNWGTPLNPYNVGYYCGGSSGGSAYAVASGLVPFAIGADGGGSIRIPSSFCGLYGIKPSHGRVSISPTVCFENTVVVQGPLAANMLDLTTSYRVLAQPDPSNTLSAQFCSPPARPLSSPAKKVLGICKPWFDRADPIVQEHCTSALQYFTSELNYQIIDIDIPLLHEGQLAHAMTILTECAASTPDISNLTPANRILMSIGKQTPATDWLLAQRVRNLLMQHLASLFKTHPGLIIVTPTTRGAGWKIQPGELGYGMSDGNSQMRSMEFVWLANFTGVPCVQFPVGYADKEGGKVPIGMCGHGEWGSEEELLGFGCDGERWLHEGSKEGRVMPGEGRWVDVLGMAAEKARN